MSVKFPVWLSIVLIVTAACTSSPVDVVTPAISTQENVSVIPVDTVALLPTPEAVSAPKQKDLLFVEFFAVT
jgi:hypothetical protein